MSVGCAWSFHLCCVYQPQGVWGSHWAWECSRNCWSESWRVYVLSCRRTNRSHLSEWVCGLNWGGCWLVKLGEEWMCFLQTVWISTCWKTRNIWLKQQIKLFNTHSFICWELVSVRTSKHIAWNFSNLINYLRAISLQMQWLYLCERVGESSASVGSNRNTASSSGLPVSACMALRGRVRSLSQMSFVGVQGTGLFQRGRKGGEGRKDKSLQPKHTMDYEKRPEKRKSVILQC